jgi:hypothetical protein
MNMEELLKINKTQEEKIILLENELKETKEHLKKYTAPTRSKTYYRTTGNSGSDLLTIVFPVNLE